MKGLCRSRDVRRFGAGELRHARLLRHHHVDDRRAGIDRSHDRIGARVDRLLHQRARGLRIGLSVHVGHLDLLAENAARRVDLVDGHMRAVVEVRAGDGAGARELADARDVDRVVRQRRVRSRSGSSTAASAARRQKFSPIHLSLLPFVRPQGSVELRRRIRRNACPGAQSLFFIVVGYGKDSERPGSRNLRARSRSSRWRPRSWSDAGPAAGS